MKLERLKLESTTEVGKLLLSLERSIEVGKFKWTWKLKLKSVTAHNLSFPTSIFPISFRTFHFIVLSNCPFELHISHQLACRLEIPCVGRSPQNSILEVKRRSIKIFHSYFEWMQAKIFIEFFSLNFDKRDWPRSLPRFKILCYQATWSKIHLKVR